jgi:hypothetical protein
MNILSENDDVSMSIEHTNNLFHLKQTNTRDKYHIKNNNKNKYGEIAYPFSKRIKLKLKINQYNILRTLL